MRTTIIKTTSHEENWKVCNELYEKGFIKIADSFWCKVFNNYETNEEVIVEFEYKI